MHVSNSVLIASTFTLNLPIYCLMKCHILLCYET